MPFSRYALKGDINISDIINIIKYRRQFSKLHPDYFKPDGTLLFCGPQGSGKTLSAVRYVYNLKQLYPKAIVISNMDLSFCDVIPYIGLNQSYEKLCTNGEFGNIILLDEMQVEFNSAESTSLSIKTLASISQQRKRRVHIVGTTQLFTRVSKGFREQVNGAVDCDCFAGILQRNRIIDFRRCAYDINGNLTETAYSGQFFWTRSPKLFDMYDTTNVISRMGVGDLDDKRSWR